MAQCNINTVRGDNSISEEELDELTMIDNWSTTWGRGQGELISQSKFNVDQNCDHKAIKENSNKVYHVKI